MRRCPNPSCQAQVPDDAAFCRRCGTPLTSQAQGTPSPRQATTRNSVAKNSPNDTDDIIRLADDHASHAKRNASVSENGFENVASSSVQPSVPSSMPSSVPSPVPASAQPPTPAPTPAQPMPSPAPQQGSPSPTVTDTMGTSSMYGSDAINQRISDLEFNLAEARYAILKAEREGDMKSVSEYKYNVIPKVERELDILNNAVGRGTPATPAGMNFGVGPAGMQPIPNGGNPGIKCLIFDIVCALLLLFVPWIDVNIPLVSGSYTLVDFAVKCSSLASNVGSMSSWSSSAGDTAQTIAGVAAITGLALLVVGCLLVFDMFADFNINKRKSSIGSIALTVTACLLYILVLGIVSSMNGSGSSSFDSLASSVAREMVQCTGWVFISACMGVVSHVVHRNIQKKIDIANGVTPAPTPAPSQPPVMQ